MTLDMIGFVECLMSEYYRGGPCDIDGGTMQEIALRFGVIKPCGDDCEAFQNESCDCGRAGDGFTVADLRKEKP